MNPTRPSSTIASHGGEGEFRLLLFNLTTDENDPILGFTTRWLNALAPHCERIDVLTMSKGRFELPGNVNVYSVGKERGLTGLQRIREFYRQLPDLVSRHHYNACFAHMMHVFVAMGGRCLRRNRIPITLWYTHRSKPLTLRWALRYVDHVVTAVPTSFPIQTTRGLALGHGIDTGYYTPSEEKPANRPLVIQVARLSPIKNQHTLLKAMKSVDADLAFIGGVPEGLSDAYRQRLVRLAGELGISERVTFTGELTAGQTREWMRRASVSVNLSPDGLFDKAPLESMACEVPTMASNPAFNTIYQAYTPDLHIEHADDPDTLSRRLTKLLQKGNSERATMGAELRKHIEQQHGLKNLSLKLMEILKTGQAPKGSTPTSP